MGMEVSKVSSDLYRKLVEESQSPEALENTVEYLAEHLGKFLSRQESVLICFSEHKEGNLSWLMEQAVLRCGANPVIWGPDHRWKTLLQQAFFSRATAIIGPPQVVLGLTKLKKYNQVPLYIRKVVTAGYPCTEWMIDGIAAGFDCRAGGCFGLGESGIVAGFACGHCLGFHLRRDVYGMDIVDADGNSLPPGELGEMVLYSRKNPDLRYPMGEYGRVEIHRCNCGSEGIRLMDLCPGSKTDIELLELLQYLQSWTSILDCRLKRSEQGLEIEIVCFPGEKLPKLPTAAKLVIRPWNPKHDEPFSYNPSMKITKNG